MDLVTPNFDLAESALQTLSESQLECYLCHHGPRRYDRQELRDTVAANMQPDIYPERKDVYLALAIYLYRAGHTRTVLNALQFEGFAPGPPPERKMNEATDFGQPRWWTSYEWALGGRRPTFRGKTIWNWQPLLGLGQK